MKVSATALEPGTVLGLISRPTGATLKVGEIARTGAQRGRLISRPTGATLKVTHEDKAKLDGIGSSPGQRERH